MDEISRGALLSTRKHVLEAVANDRAGDPAGERAQRVLEARQAIKRAEVLEKLIADGRFHPDFNVIGTKSGRMSGTGGLNAQGIPHAPEIRACFPLGENLWGGDFDSFEVALAAAAYRDEQLIADLKTGRKVHGIFGAMLSGLTYEQVIATKGDGTRDWYDTGKKGFLALIYGGDSGTIVRKLGVDPEAAEAAYQAFLNKYPQLAEARQEVIDQFCSMRQPGGIGTQVEWHAPAESVTSLLGWPRYFTLETEIARMLFDLAAEPPEDWGKWPKGGRVLRRKKPQTLQGAVQSALYGAAFSVQAAAMRAAGNHRIQSTGAGICKHVQRAVWECQPCGCEPFLVSGFQVHDELMVDVHSDYARTVAVAVEQTVESYRELVPLIRFDWGKLSHWGEK
jgi:DNA polymerase I-like protein with 3'-5' exonuclease and polymerase domains